MDKPINETYSKNARREFIEYFGYTPEQGAVMQAQAETFRPDRVGGNIYRRLSNEGKEQREKIDPFGKM